MSKDDVSGFIGAILCAGVGWYDESWRLFWFGSGIVLGVWTIWSLKNGKTE